MQEVFFSLAERADRVRWLIVGLPVVLVCLVIISLLPPPAELPEDTSSYSHESSLGAISMNDSPNAVTAGLSLASDKVTQSLHATEKAALKGARSVHMAAANSGKAIVNGLRGSALFIGKGIKSSIAFLGSAASKSGLFIVGVISGGANTIASVPEAIGGFTSKAPVVSALIKPSDKAPAPIIDEQLSTAFIAHSDLPDTHTVHQTDTTAVWPVHGQITTLFGVPHWPYQRVHTGLDISDGTAPGTTPVKPFRPGRVINTVKSNVGLGNYIVLDHGNGLTSLYAHLSSISVSIGQMVDKTTVLGMQGSTGASTGTHLHFEIRQDGQAVDPLKFIGSHP